IPAPFRTGRRRPLRRIRGSARRGPADPCSLCAHPRRRGVSHDVYPQAARAALPQEARPSAVAGARGQDLERVSAPRVRRCRGTRTPAAVGAILSSAAAVRAAGETRRAVGAGWLRPCAPADADEEPVLMRILGISAHYHDSAAALLIDGMPICAVQEERLSRRKNDAAFPLSAIEWCLEQGHLEPEQLDAGVFYEKPMLKFDRILTMALRGFPRTWRSFPRAMQNALGGKLWVKGIIASQLGIRPERILFCEHHQSHAAAAFLTAPVQRAAILTADGDGQRCADIAASVQRVLEEILVDLARRLQRETGLPDLCLGGGVALNGVANARILRESGFSNLYVPPAPGDAGCAMGAALYADRIHFGRRHGAFPDHPYWGPVVDASELAHIAAEDGFEAHRLTEPELLPRIADELAQGRIVGWMQGACELGPRALGNRSILAAPHDASMREHLNRSIKYREEFRPFAPAVPIELADR